jgi:DNA repair photolyase
VPERRPRGAVSNPTGRYERHQCIPETPLEASRTTLTAEASRSALARNDSPDVPFDRSLNPYRGCEHGCIYCFARPTHAWLGMSPGLDFETKILYRPQAPQRLRAELAARRYRCEPVALGSNTDPYQPVERGTRLTRALLEVLLEHRHPLTIVTKSDLVLEDLDLLGELARQRLAAVMLSVTNLDPELARRMEPRAPTPERRLRAIRELAAAGVPVGVLTSPIVPGLNDDELERLLESSAAAGAGWAGWVLLRLPGEVGPLFEEWLRAEYPERAERVLNRVRETRGGELYRSRFGERMRGRGPTADLLKQRFAVACRRLGLSRHPPALDTTAFRVPAGPGSQGRLFE